MICAICGATPVVATLHRPTANHELCWAHLELCRTFNYRFGLDVDADLTIHNPEAAAA